MPGPRETVEGTLRSVGRNAAGLGISVARTLHSHWRRMSAGERRQLEPLADDVRRQALDLRGAQDREAADRELSHANRRLADAMVEVAESDPEMSEDEVLALREDLARELARLATADVRVSRGGRVRQ